MAITAAQAMGYIIPIISGFVYSVLGLAACIGLWYYLFIYKRRKFWLVDVYEQKSDGKLYLVDKDRLIQKKINFGKKTIYLFKKTQTESIPPPYECVTRYNNKEYCDYVRVLGEYIPLRKNENNMPNFSDHEVRRSITQTIMKHLLFIRHTNDDEVIRQKYVYLPIYKALKYDIDYKPMSYDVNMMRINEIDSLDQMFKDKQSFWDKYHGVIMIGAGIVFVVVLAWFGFEYSQKVIEQTLGAADKVAGPLQSIAERLTKNVPAS